jgi:hypothetical protein
MSVQTPLASLSVIALVYEYKIQIEVFICSFVRMFTIDMSREASLSEGCGEAEAILADNLLNPSFNLLLRCLLCLYVIYVLIYFYIYQLIMRLFD